MTSRTYQQFTRFTTDAYGLERTFRLLQAIAQVLSSYPVLFNLLLLCQQVLAGAPHPPSAETTHAVLLGLRARLALARRYLRVFRFLDSFRAGYQLYANLSADEPTTAGASGEKKEEEEEEKKRRRKKKKASWRHATAYLDLFAATFNGMYLLLEASTLVDAMQVAGLRVYAPATELRVNIEAQRFWLFALVCSAVAGLLRMVEVAAYTPVPATGDGFAHGKDEGRAVVDEEKKRTGEKDSSSSSSTWPAEKGAAANDKDDKDDDGDSFELVREQARLRRIVSERRAGRAVWRRSVVGQLRRLARNVAANLVDLALPGSFVGWLDISPGAVGVATLITTVLTSVDVWERCGREVAAAAAR